MLNKELLITSAKKKEQRKVKLTIGRHESFGLIAFGYNKDFYGSLDVVPYWGTTNDVMSSLIYLLSVVEMTTLGAPSEVTVFVEGYTQSISSSNTQDGDTYSMNNSEGKIRYLTFDPPDRVLGSRDTQTDLKYYVEEVPWEVQNAEQGTSDGWWRRGVVDSTMQVHRGLLFRSNSTGLKRSNSLEWASKHRYCDGSSASREYPDTFRDCWSIRYYKSRWVSSGRGKTRNRHHIATKRCVSRATLSSVTSKEALYA